MPVLVVPVHGGILCRYEVCRVLDVYGLWRSLVARLTGGQEVAGSNPASPTLTSLRLSYVDHSTEVYRIVTTRRAALEPFPLAHTNKA